MQLCYTIFIPLIIAVCRDVPSPSNDDKRNLASHLTSVFPAIRVASTDGSSIEYVSILNEYEIISSLQNLSMVLLDITPPPSSWNSSPFLQFVMASLPCYLSMVEFTDYQYSLIRSQWLTTPKLPRKTWSSCCYWYLLCKHVGLLGRLKIIPNCNSHIICEYFQGHLFHISPSQGGAIEYCIKNLKRVAKKRLGLLPPQKRQRTDMGAKEKTDSLPSTSTPPQQQGSQSEDKQRKSVRSC